MHKHSDPHSKSSSGGQLDNTCIMSQWTSMS